jgi:sporulation protein YlmC with PRC-barrel domain
MFDLGRAQEHQMGTEQNSPTAAAGHGGEGRRLVVSNNVKGTPVYAPDGNRLGRIERVMADEATGEIVYAIVNFGLGNSVGFETDHHPVPWSLLAYNPRFDGYELRITNRQVSQRL